MAQPAFTWWPWRLIAISVPLIALAGGFLAVNTPQTSMGVMTREQKIILIVLTLYGTGNAMLMGWAIGDFGRTLLAVFATAGASILAVNWLGHGVIGLGPFMVVAAWAGCLALEFKVRSIFEAAFTALWSFILGAAAGLILVAILWVILAFIFSITNSHQIRLIGESIAWALSASVANAIFIGRLFRAAFRVSATEPVANEDLREKKAEESAEQTQRRMSKLKSIKARLHEESAEGEEQGTAANRESK